MGCIINHRCWGFLCVHDVCFSVTAVEVNGSYQFQVRVHAADAVDVPAVFEARPHRSLVEVFWLAPHPDDDAARSGNTDVSYKSI